MNVRSLDKYRKEQEKKQRELKRKQQLRRKQAEALRRSMERPGRPTAKYGHAVPYESHEERVWRVPRQPGRGFVEAWPWFVGVFLISLILGFLLQF